MKILKSEECSLADYCGNILLSYLYMDKESADTVAKWLDELGYHYERNEISPSTLIGGAFCERSNALLKNCGCYIFPLTTNFNENNRPLVNIILYQAGYLESIGHNGIMPVIMYPEKFDIKKAKTLAALEKDEKRDPKETYYIKQKDMPIDKAQAAKSKEEFATALKNNFHRSVSVNDFYDDPRVNATLKERLLYRRIEVSFDITNGDFKKGLKFYRQKEAFPKADADNLIHWLNTECTCATHVISFGSESTLTNSTKPYAGEAVLDPEKSYCVQLENCRSYYVKNESASQADSDIHGTFIAEFLIPVHKLLGVNFKCFLRGKANNDPGGIDQTQESDAILLEKLFNSNFKEENDISKHQDRLYFSFNFKNNPSFDIPPSLGIKADYLHPQ